MDSCDTPCRDIIISPKPYLATKVMSVEHGITLRMIIDRMYDYQGIPIVYRYYDIIVELNGEVIPPDRWNIIPKPDDHILISIPIHGGGGGGSKNPWRTILSLVVVVIAAVATWYFGGAGGWLSAGALGLKGVGAALYGAAWGAGISVVGSLAINAMFPIKTPTLGDTGGGSPAYSLQGTRNNFIPWGTIPVILGRHKVYPVYGAKPYTEVVGDKEYLRCLFVWGYGPLKIHTETLKLGETLLSSYSNVEMEHREGYIDDEDITLIPQSVFQDSINLEIKAADGIVTRTAKPNVDEIGVDMLYPSGCWAKNTSGTEFAYQIDIKVYYREVGGEWVQVLDEDGVNPFYVRAYTKKALRRGYTWTVDKTKSYEVGMDRITMDASLTGPTIFASNTVWSSLKAIRNTHPVDFPYPIAMTALRIKATDQLQGVIETLNGEVTSIGEDWDGDTWSGAEEIQNPAALARLVLKHNANVKRRTDEQIDDASFGEFYDFCETNGYEFNMIRDCQVSVWDTVADVVSAGRGAPTMIDGKWGVIWDDADRTLIHHITPRNSWGFNAEKLLFNMPHGLRIKFTNELNGYLQDERIVYSDGYDETNATEFESIGFSGITHPDLVWQFGRYHLAQAQLRPEIYTVNMDFEHLVCRRGDKVAVAYDSILVGLVQGRVKEIIYQDDDPETEVVLGVVLDTPIAYQYGRDYVCRFQSLEAETYTQVLSIVNPGSTEQAEMLFTVEGGLPEADAPAVGHLALFGEASRESSYMLVKQINRTNDFTAQIVLVDESPAIYEADQGEIPPYDPNVSINPNYMQIQPAAPTIYQLESGTLALEETPSGLKARLFVYLAPGSGTIRIDHYLVRYRISGNEDWEYIQTASESTFVIISDVIEGEWYEIEAQAISIYGVASFWTSTYENEILGQTELPADVTGFLVSTVGGVAYLTWAPVSDLDLSHYRIRWSNDTVAAAWDEAIDLVLKVGKPATSITVPAMVGTYLIKAVDYAGYESENAALAVTSISYVMGLNIVEAITLPPWTGAEDGLVYGDGYLTGEFDLPLEGLTSGKNYKYCAYVQDSDGNISYGNIVDFQTL